MGNLKSKLTGNLHQSFGISKDIPLLSPRKSAHPLEVADSV
ncbi:hypothetical protein PJE062_1190 [Pseudovibrio sp. JE062]|nr:hypothetical protein PJE062_1190 [Pseudovibrio sp. JE062]